MAEVKAKLVLPSVKSEVDRRWVSQDFLVIGPPKIGKSEFFSFGDRTLYLETEPGLKHLSVMKVPCLCWADFVAVYEQLLALTKSGKDFPYDTLVIDTVDRWVDYLNDEVVARGQSKFKSAEINSIGDIPNGQGYSWASEKLGNALAKLSELPCAIVLIGHLASKEISFENNVKMTMQTIALTPSIGKNICSWADQIMSIEGGNKTGDRKVRTRPSSSVMAGSRGSILPEDMVWTRDNKANYENLRKLFT